MAASDYRLCDICHAKVFYDRVLDYQKAEPGEDDSKQCGKPTSLRLDNLGDWTVICRECAKTHETLFVRTQ